MTLWTALTHASHDASVLTKITQHVTAPLKQGKISSPEHRIVLYQALGDLVSTPSLSHLIVTDGYLPALTGTKKETNEAAMTAAIQGAGKHFSVILYDDAYCGAHSDLMATIVKVMTEGLTLPKAGQRTAWAHVVGKTYWTHQQPSLTLADQVVRYLTPLFATTAKIQEKPLAWKDGPFEGYVLVALLSGRFQSNPAVDALVKKHQYPACVLPPKPGKSAAATTNGGSFLLMDRVYMKAVSLEEGLWLTHALISLLKHLDEATLTEIGGLIGQALIWLVTSHPVHQVRQQAYRSLAVTCRTHANDLAHLMLPALTLWLVQLEKETKGSVPVAAAASVPESTDPLVAHYRLLSVLMAMTSFAFVPDMDENTKASILVDLIVLAHHKFIGKRNE